MDGYKEYVAQNGGIQQIRREVSGARRPIRRSGRLLADPQRGAGIQKDYETRLACYNSPEYARLVAIRSPMPKATS